MAESLFSLPFDTRALPPHDADRAAFSMPPGRQRELAVAWAWQAILHPTEHSDQDLMRACWVLIVNSNEHFNAASQMLKVLRSKQ